MSWRLVILKEVDPFECSSYQEMFVIARRRNLIPDTLYLTTFSQRTVAVGTKSNLKSVAKIPFCESQNISITRYGAAGGISYHDNHNSSQILGFFAYMPHTEITAREERDLLGRCVIYSLDLLGIKAEIEGNNVMVEGGKVGTLAPHFLKGVLVDVFNLLPDFDFDIAEKAIFSKHDMREKMSTLNMKLGRKLFFNEMVDALKQGFEKGLEIEFNVTDRLTEAEKEIVASLREKYTSEQWIKTGRWSTVKDYGRLE